MATDSSSQPMRIAVVGMACRLSGGVSSLDDFWQMLARSRSGWSKVPETRFSKEAYHHPNPAKMGAFNAEGGYFIDQDPALFDAPFFNITQAEAEAMDPQQRLLLECAYEAVENAGIPKERLIGQNVGVFVGGVMSAYQLGSLRDLEHTPMFDATGNHQAVMSGRISHYFDLRGPSFSVDTACSSSLYALHQAVQSLRSGESEQAIVAASHLNLQPGDWVSMSLSRLFSDEGKTYAFDHRAKSGFARGEGASAVILKPLDQAIRDNDQIRAVIVNSGANQDGRTVGITSPSGAAQEQLMREVYARAGIRPEDAGFVEAHGTGTKVGDPIEAQAIRNVFSGPGRTAEKPLWVGSVKSNVGHTENASGLVSLIKACLMLEKRFILPNTNYEAANPNIAFDAWHGRVPTTQRPWPDDKRYISVNNFGFGGSNAHCVLERAPAPPERPELVVEDDEAAGLVRPRLLVLSANDEAAARQSMAQLSIYLEQHPEVFQKMLMRHLAHTLDNRRSHLGWRLGLVAKSSAELVAQLSAADTKPVRAAAGQTPHIAFVYTGQGAQWHAMGRELLQSHPVFAATIRAADACLQRLGADFSLQEELLRDKETSRVGQAHISQPICSAVQLGLTDLLRSWGITPTSVTGHSSGEIGAAYAAGALSFESAMAVAYQRGQVVLRLRARHGDLHGAMLAVGAGADAMRPLAEAISQKGDRGVVVVACENSPSSVTASGDATAVDALAVEAEAQQLFNRKLRVDVAYHSPHMKLVAADYLETIREVPTPPATSPSGVRFFSSLRGQEISLDQLGPDYWVDNLTCPVRFATALHVLGTTCPTDVVLEVGPHGALEGPVKQTLKGLADQKAASKISYLSVLSRGKNATTTALQAAAGLYMKGLTALDFDAINGEAEVAALDGPPTLLADLAPYPWSRQRYWNESRLSQQHRLKPFPRHDLLGLLADVSNNDVAPMWRSILRTADLPWLHDHKMQGLTTFPFAAFVAMAVEAAAQRAAMRRGDVAIGAFRLREMTVSRPLLMEEGAAYEMVLSMAAYAEGTRGYSDEWDEFRICSWQPGPGWTEHCRGLIGVQAAGADDKNMVSEAHRGLATRFVQRAEAACTQPIDVPSFYAELSEKGAIYGPTFRKLRDVHIDNRCYAAAHVDVADTAATMPLGHESPYHIHPALLDQVFQLAYPVLGAGRPAHDQLRALYMPSAIREMTIENRPTKLGTSLRVVAEGYPNLAAPKPTDFAMTALTAAADADHLVSLSGMQMMPIKGEGAAADAPRELCYKLQWETVEGEAVEAVQHKPVGTPPLPSSFGSRSNLSLSAYGSSVDRATVASGASSDDGLSIRTGSWTDVLAARNGSWTDVSARNGSIDSGIPADPSPTRELSFRLAAAAAPVWPDLVVAIVSDLPPSHPAVVDLVEAVRSKTGTAPTVSALEDAPAAVGVHFIVCELDRPLLDALTPLRFARLQHIATAAAGLLWVTQGAYLHAAHPTGSMALGLTRTLRSEMAAKVATLDLDPRRRLGHQTDLILDVFAKVFRDDACTDMEFSEDDGRLVVPRIVEDVDANLLVHRALGQAAPYPQDFVQPGRRLRIDVATPGALDSLYFRDDPLAPLGDAEIEVHVEATGMNFKDVVIAMGQLPSPYLGIECAGVVVRVGQAVRNLAPGDRVAAMTEGAYGTVARCLATSAARIPDSMTFTVAASIPVVYCTAYYGLIELGRMRAGDRVLIHAAAGGVGQAAIQLAQLWGAEVYATVGSPDKKRFLQERYRIPADRIFCSRDTSFAPAVRAATDGEGVDLVLNSLAGDMLRATWDCLAHFGRFVEIGKRDITANTRLEMARFQWNASFHSVDLTVLATERPRHMAQTFAAVLQLFESAAVRPIGPLTVYGVGEIETAFRLLQSGKTTGKLIVVPRPGEQVCAVHPQDADTARLLRPDAAYLIVGGTGGLGRSIARWMVAQGGRHIVLLSRSGRVDGPVAGLVRDLEAAGATIVVRACDVADEPSVQRVVRECQLPIAGVVHSSMVLRDVLFEKMTFDDYDAVIRSKVAGAWNLHRALLTAPPLDFFVVLSSVAGAVGNRGQAAYAAANTFLDAFARYRSQRGLPTTALDLAAVADVGYLVDQADATRHADVLKNIGGQSIREAEILALLRAAVAGTLHQTCANHCITGLQLAGAAGGVTSASQLPYFAADAKFAHMRAAVLEAAGAAGASAAEVSLATALKQAAPDQAASLVTAALAAKLAGILMVPADELDPATPITKYGLDSLNAIELRNWITKELATNLQVLELLTGGSLTNLAAIILKKRAEKA